MGWRWRRDPVRAVACRAGGYARRRTRQAAYKGPRTGRDAGPGRYDEGSTRRRRGPTSAITFHAPDREDHEDHKTARPRAVDREDRLDREGSRRVARQRRRVTALDALGKEGSWRVGGNELKLTNLDKLFDTDP